LKALGQTKTLKEWSQNPSENLKDLKNQNREASMPSVKRVLTDGKALRPNGVVTPTPPIADDEEVTNFDEFSPSWRKKSVKEMAKTSKNKNALSFVWSYFLIGALLIGISIGSFVLWEQVINNKVNKVDIDVSDFIDSPSGGDSPSTVRTEKEITFYVVEIGVSGNREVAVNELETSCGDILVPVKKNAVFNSVSISNIAIIRESLNQLFSEVGEVYDEEKNLVNDVAESGLTINTIAKVGDDYEVDLTGELNTVGVCNTERIFAQIEETAKVNLSGVKITFKMDGSVDKYAKLQED
jgi:hypothetical protein